ncbi:anaerobic glycerol-3-phosphate dehydrogenase subunit GlpA [Deferribacterales bacterium RsTz2092]
MQHYSVIIVGGGVTGAGVLRDLSMRGIKALLIEQSDFVNGASSRFHGLLHSGGRYAVKDPSAATECAKENAILRRIAPNCVKNIGGLFIRTKEDDEHYEKQWLAACKTAKVSVAQVDVADVLASEPNIAKDIISAYKVSDAAVDGFRMVNQTLLSAGRYGGQFRNYTELIRINVSGGRVVGINVIDKRTDEEQYIECDYLVNAAGSWADRVANLAGLSINITPNRGLLLAFNHRMCSRVINRLHAPSNADIMVPHGTVAILGTTSVNVSEPADNSVLYQESMEMLGIGEVLFPDIMNYRILRGFSGTRPLYTPSAESGRDVSRGFALINHEDEGIAGFTSIVGGKFTTFRLMGEKVGNFIAEKLSVVARCRTAEESLVSAVPNWLVVKGKKYFPNKGLQLALERQPAQFDKLVERLETNASNRSLLCECELVTRAEFEAELANPLNTSIDDIRRRTRLGMGTCQGTFCIYRIVSAICESRGGEMDSDEVLELFSNFMNGRWKGIRAVLWGSQMREAELNRAIYSTMFGADGLL